jgi:hypothetical protein
MARSNSTYCAKAIPIKLPHNLRSVEEAIPINFHILRGAPMGQSGGAILGAGGRRERPSLAMPPTLSNNNNVARTTRTDKQQQQ